MSSLLGFGGRSNGDWQARSNILARLTRPSMQSPSITKASLRLAGPWAAAAFIRICLVVAMPPCTGRGTGGEVSARSETAAAALYS